MCKNKYAFLLIQISIILESKYYNFIYNDSKGNVICTQQQEVQDDCGLCFPAHVQQV